MLDPFQVAQPQQLFVAVVRQHGIEVGVVHRAVTHIPFPQYPRIAGIERETILPYSRAGSNTRGISAVAAHRCGGFTVSLCAGAATPQRDAGTKSARAVGRCTHTPLYLDALQCVGEVGKIDPVDLLALGVVQRHPVEGDIDACGIGAADSEKGVAHPQAILREGDKGGSGLKNSRDMAACILFFDISSADGSVGYRCFDSCPCGGYNHLFELNKRQTVCRNSFYVRRILHLLPAFSFLRFRCV